MKLQRILLILFCFAEGVLTGAWFCSLFHENLWELLKVGPPILGVGIGIWAANSWSRTLKAKRGDDLLAAVYDLTPSILDLEDAIIGDLAYEIFRSRADRLYTGLNTTQKAYVVARRSYREFSDSRFVAVRSAVDRLKAAGDLFYAAGSRRAVNQRAFGCRAEMAKQAISEFRALIETTVN